MYKGDSGQFLKGEEGETEEGGGGKEKCIQESMQTQKGPASRWENSASRSSEAELAMSCGICR